MGSRSARGNQLSIGRLMTLIALSTLWLAVLGQALRTHGAERDAILVATILNPLLVGMVGLWFGLTGLRGEGWILLAAVALLFAPLYGLAMLFFVVASQAPGAIPALLLQSLVMILGLAVRASR